MNKRLNDATPEDWNRLRTNHPALEKPSMLDSWMKAAHNENADLWEDEEEEDTDHYDMTTEKGRQEVWELFSKVNQDDDDDDDYEDEHDAVHNPAHYNTGSIECIEAIAESMSTEAFRGYLKGTA